MCLRIDSYFMDPCKYRYKEAINLMYYNLARFVPLSTAQHNFLHSHFLHHHHLPLFVSIFHLAQSVESNPIYVEATSSYTQHKTTRMGAPATTKNESTYYTSAIPRIIYRGRISWSSCFPLRYIIIITPYSSAPSIAHQSLVGAVRKMPLGVWHK